MLSVDQCPVCGNSEFVPLHSCLDTTVSNEIFEIKVCKHCTLGITTPRPENSVIGNYYLSHNYISHSGSNGILGKIYLLARKFTLTWKSKIVETHCKKGTIIDFGCGTGEFLHEMKNKDWEVIGVEPSEEARHKAEAITAQSIHSNIHELAEKQVDAITLWHVLEHVPDLTTSLKKFLNLLSEDGSLIIAVPNYQSADAKHYKEHWAGYDVPRHLWHFTKESMRLLLQQNGFTVNHIIPMNLDAYYISLLSEKNKDSNVLIRYIQGFIQGLTSNLKARKNVNHSSLIYIAKPI